MEGGLGGVSGGDAAHLPAHTHKLAPVVLDAISHAEPPPPSPPPPRFREKEGDVDIHQETTDDGTETTDMDTASKGGWREGSADLLEGSDSEMLSAAGSGAHLPDEGAGVRGGLGGGGASLNGRAASGTSLSAAGEAASEAGASSLQGASLLASDDDLSEPEEVDDRVEGLLEQLNTASDNINTFETNLATARKHYLHVGQETERHCQELARGFKRNIKRSAMYYHKKALAKAQQNSANKLMMQFNEACEAHQRAKQALNEAEARIEGSTGFVPALQAQMSDAATAVLEAQARKDAAAHAHQAELEKAAATMSEVDQMGRNTLLRRDINNARPYYVAKERSEHLRQQGLSKVVQYDRLLREAKASYAQALESLSRVSEEVHNSRVARRQHGSSSAATSASASAAASEADTGAARGKAGAWGRGQQAVAVAAAGAGQGGAGAVACSVDLDDIQHAFHGVGEAEAAGVAAAMGAGVGQSASDDDEGGAHRSDATTERGDERGRLGSPAKCAEERIRAPSEQRWVHSGDRNADGNTALDGACTGMEAIRVTLPGVSDGEKPISTHNDSDTETETDSEFETPDHLGVEGFDPMSLGPSLQNSFGAGTTAFMDTGALEALYNT